VQRDVEYAKVDGESLKLDVSVPAGEGPFPVAILVHGGGWGGGDKTHVHVPPTKPFTDARFTWFSIDYRLAPADHWPACIDDVRTAIRWVKDHAQEYRGDPARIVLVGYSAGGHLAAYAAVAANDDTRVQAAVLFAAPTDLEADSERRGGLSPSLQSLFDRGPTIDDDARAILQTASPIVRARADAPPCLLIHGTVDESVFYNQSLNFKSRLEDLGVPCQLITIPGGSHDVKAWDLIEPQYDSRVVEWLRRTFNPSP
jgi:alpha-L-fucosidase 2